MANSTKRNNEGGQAQAVIRACDIVRAFRHEGEELQLGDVVERSGLRRTTAFRLLQGLGGQARQSKEKERSHADSRGCLPLSETQQQVPDIQVRQPFDILPNPLRYPGIAHHRR